MPVKTKQHKPNRHHCVTLDDLKPLITQLGFTVSSKAWENDKTAIAMSVEKSGWHHEAIAHLNKTTGVLEIRTIDREPKI